MDMYGYDVQKLTERFGRNGLTFEHRDGEFTALSRGMVTDTAADAGVLASLVSDRLVRQVSDRICPDYRGRRLAR